MLRKGRRFHVAAGLLVLLAVACTSYERQVVPFKLPSAYPNATEAAGAVIAARAYDDDKEAAEAFGFDIRGAGILPVQVIFDNKGRHRLEIVPEKTLLVDREDNLWPILDKELAYDRIEKKTELGKVAPEAGKMGMLGGLAGATIGAAIGIVTGHNVGDAVMKGAALGGAAGATMGGSKGFAESDARHEIRDDLKTRSLEKKAINPQDIAHGFIFFPGEAKKSRELRLQIRALDSGETFFITLKF
ncbi:MAG: hypothetical protein HY742_04280 [Deltaproteobacteria bacterium]|nr:hypothetical protein [Deltaproteobacteria bacterium]